MEDIKSIRIELDFADEKGIRTKKEQTIKVNTPSLVDKSKPVWHYHKNSIYTLSFTIQIPEFIHSYLIGKSVPSSRSEKTKDYQKDDFKKSITTNTIEHLTKMWCELIGDYVWLKKMENANLKKVIFYEISNKCDNFKSYWDGKEFGVFAELNYKYSVGYITMVEKSEIRYNSQKLAISSGNDRAFYELKCVEWTPEREVFFENIQKSFQAIADKLNSFESNISEDTIDGLISNSPLQLTN
jgi:hypothetical protein